MARPPKPWWNEDRGEYNVNIRGERHSLGPDKDEAERKFHALMAKPPEEPVKSESVAAVMDLFLTDAKEDCAEETYKWYRKHCQAFLDYLKGRGRKYPRFRPSPSYRQIVPGLKEDVVFGYEERGVPCGATWRSVGLPKWGILSRIPSRSSRRNLNLDGGKTSSRRGVCSPPKQRKGRMLPGSPYRFVAMWLTNGSGTIPPSVRVRLCGRAVNWKNGMADMAHDPRISKIFYYFEKHTTIASGRTVGRKIGVVQEILCKKLLMMSERIRDSIIFEPKIHGLLVRHKVDSFCSNL